MWEPGLFCLFYITKNIICIKPTQTRKSFTFENINYFSECIAYINFNKAHISVYTRFIRSNSNLMTWCHPRSIFRMITSLRSRELHALYSAGYILIIDAVTAINTFTSVCFPLFQTHVAILVCDISTYRT